MKKQSTSMKLPPLSLALLIALSFTIPAGSYAGGYYKDVEVVEICFKTKKMKWDNRKREQRTLCVGDKRGQWSRPRIQTENADKYGHCKADIRDYKSKVKLNISKKHPSLGDFVSSVIFECAN